MEHNDKNSKDSALTPIPVSFVVEQGLHEHTEAKRRPYRTLITAWATHEDMVQQGEAAVSQLKIGNEPEQLKDLRNLPNSVGIKYRKGEKAEKLVMTIREISNMVANDSNWNWALVMKVMLNEGLLITDIPNQFDRLICSMVPGKKPDSVRKNGNYDIIKSERSWREWISNSHDDWKEAVDRAICQQIFEMFKPILDIEQPSEASKTP